MTIARALSSLLVTALVFSGNVAAQERPAYSETVEVRIGTVDVIVTKDGRHVTGLRPQDFELYENGKLQTISNFYEAVAERGAEMPQAAPPPSAAVPDLSRRRVVAFVIDAYSLHPHVRNEFLRSMRRFAEENLRPGDLAMVAVWNHSLKIPLTFTEDHAAVAEQLDALSKVGGRGLAEEEAIVELMVRSAAEEAEVSSGAKGPVNFQQAYGIALDRVRNYAVTERKLVLNMADDLKGLIRGIAGIEGRKIVVFAGEHFPQYPGLGLYQYANDTFQRYTVQLVQPQLVAGGNSLANVPGEIARTANENDVTLHCIYSGEGTGTSPAERQSSEDRSSIRQFLEFSDTGSTFAAFAKETGGVALTGTKNFELAAKTLAEDFDQYYSLAYRLDPSATGERRIVVRMKDPSLSVRTRKSIFAKSLDDEISSRVSSSLLQDGTRSSAEIRVIAGKPKNGRNRITVPIDVVFPSSLLTLLPQGGNVTGGFEVMIAAADDFNRLSEVSRQKQDVSWAEGKVPPTVTFHFETVVRNRPGRLAIAVVDRWSRASWQTKVNVAR